ncbi:MAG: choline dehydrogenase [Rhodospirillaceae bacterium]|nr:choline dehydrogenase [Rhodospirillaceae bacterium]|tara:strand:- start:1077 stop:2702 length:1626 start_codon:yes stop_codon:yes gene_type:complete
MADIFDYVIIGAGSAGCVVARRLSDANVGRICVLEAGPADRNLFIHIPAGFIRTVNNPRINWLYETEPGDWTGGRRVSQPRGKTLGGSGSINGHIVNRGQASDFETWAQLGNRGWSYAEVLPYFKRLETRVGTGDDTYRGREGPLTVTDLDWQNPLIDGFIRSAESLGIPRNPDYNGASQSGVSVAQRAVDCGRRVSPARAFLHPARKTGRLDVRTECLVERLIFDGKRAVGCTYLQGGRRHEIRANREIILSAGVFNSPQILHRSGVGEPGHLAGLGIDTVHALPSVGQNLADHCYSTVTARVKNALSLNERTRGLPLAWEVLKYAVQRRGVLSLQPSLVYASWRSDPAIADDDIQISFTPGSYDVLRNMKLDREPGMTAAGWQHRPESTGFVRALSSDPNEPPEIQPNYLDTENDRRVLLASLRLCRAILTADPLAAYYGFEMTPGPDCQTDDEWLDYIQATCGTTYHPMGSCRMGRADDPGAVVDDQLRVHGLEGLRVVDASIMPRMISANLNIATLMIGEKASDMLLSRDPLPRIEF